MSLVSFFNKEKIRKSLPLLSRASPLMLVFLIHSFFCRNRKSLDLITRRVPDTYVAQYMSNTNVIPNDIVLQSSRQHIPFVDCRSSIAVSIPYHHGSDYDRRFHPRDLFMLSLLVSTPKGTCDVSARSSQYYSKAK